MGFATTALFFALPADVLGVTLAVKVVLLVWLYRRTGIAVLPVMAMAVSAAMVWALRVPLYGIAGLAAGALTQDDILQAHEMMRLQSVVVTDMLLPGAVLMVGAIAFARDSARAAVHVLYAGACILLAGGVYCALGGWLTGAATFIRGGVFSLLAGGMGVAMLRGGATTAVWGRVMIAVTVIRTVYLDLIVANPGFDAIDVGSWPVLNGVTLVYGVGALLCLYAAVPARVGFAAGARNLCKVAAVAMVFALVTLSVRQWGAEGGILTGGPANDVELYGYSAAWLVTGLALMAYGMTTGSRAAHMAAALFIVLCAGKVFLFDAAALDGLYRVFSFFGLGLSLIALSVFYTRYAARQREQAAKGP